MARVTDSEACDVGRLFNKDIGVRGGEATSPVKLVLLGSSKNLATGDNGVLLEGIEKLRCTVAGGVGRGDAVCDAKGGDLLILFTSGPL